MVDKKQVAPNKHKALDKQRLVRVPANALKLDWKSMH
jgi:hypothetical protein